MCLHINKLADDCLLPIFDRVPLSDLFYLGRVCPRWAMLLPSACARRRALVLIGGGERLNEMQHFRIPFNDTFDVSFDGRKPYFDLSVMEQQASLTFPFSMPDTSLGGSTEADLTQLAPLRHTHLSGQLVNHLSVLLPNVDTFVMIDPQFNENEIRFLISLLGQSNWSLRTVKMWLRIRHDDFTYVGRLDHYPLRALLLSIAQQPSLRQLTLDIDDRVIRQSISFSTEYYSFIHSQLKVVNIALGKYDADSCIWDAVRRLNSTELAQIGLGARKYYVPLDVALNDQFKFTPKVAQLYGQCRFENVAQFGLFCRRFVSLTSLRMSWTPNITFPQLFTILISLAQLTHLQLKFNLSQHPENLFALMDGDGQEEEEARPISLPQVKILQLRIKKCTHQMFESLSPLLFASVEVVFLKVARCELCKRAVHLQINCRQMLIHMLKNKFSGLSIRIFVKFHGEIDWINVNEN